MYAFRMDNDANTIKLTGANLSKSPFIIHLNTLFPSFVSERDTNAYAIR